MKSRSIRVALLAAFALTSPGFVFAASQARVYNPPKVRAQKTAAAQTIDHRAVGARWNTSNPEAAIVSHASDTAFRK